MKSYVYQPIKAPGYIRLLQISAHTESQNSSSAQVCEAQDFSECDTFAGAAASTEQQRSVDLNPASINLSSASPVGSAPSGVLNEEETAAVPHCTRQQKDEECRSRSDGPTCSSISTSFKLVTLLLDEAPPYECVSYAWVTKVRAVILCLGEGTFVRVTPSLQEAMPYFVSASQTGYLWIDQLCINQDDVDERGSQVACMGKIYRGAQRLLLWLGPESEDAQTLTEIVAELEPTESIQRDCAERNDLRPKGERLLETLERFDIHSIRKFLKEKVCAEQPLQVVAQKYREAVFRVFESSWFGRAWVLQEAYLVADILVLFGSIQISAMNLKRVCDQFESKLEGYREIERIEDECTRIGRGGRAFLNHIMQRRLQPDGYGHTYSRATFGNFLWDIRCGDLRGQCNASDPRDIVFSAWSSYKLPDQLRPNYALSVANVFALAATALMRQTLDCSFLGLADGVPLTHDPDKDLSLPSWVPDWTRGCLRWPIHSIYPLEHKWKILKSQGLGYLPEFNLQVEGELRVAGKLIGTIGYISSVALERYIDDVRTDAPNFLPIAALQLELMACGSYITGDLDATRVLNAICAGTPIGRRKWKITQRLIWYDIHWLAVYNRITAQRSDPARLKIGGIPGRIHALPLWERVINSLLSRLPYKGDPSVQEWYDLIDLAAAMNAAPHRRICVTDKGRLGLISSHASKGDRIALIHGSVTPLILRKATDNRFCFVGQAYIEGTATGLAVDWHNSKDADDIVLV